MNATLRNKAAQAVRNCLDRDQADDDNRPLELWIADSVLALVEANNEANGTVWFFAIIGLAALAVFALDWLVFFVKFFMGVA